MSVDTRPTVRRRDISLSEEREREHPWGGTVSVSWTATLYGKLSTGEHVSIERSGGTHQDALKALEDAIESEGWRLHA